MKRKLLPHLSSCYFLVDIYFNDVEETVSCEISNECFQDLFNNPPTQGQWDVIENKAKEKFKDSDKKEHRLLTKDDFQSSIK